MALKRSVRREQMINYHQSSTKRPLENQLSDVQDAPKLDIIGKIADTKRHVAYCAEK